MTTKNSNRALLTSVVALILCCSMLIGSTFAWFTDSATSGVNTIQAGNLDVKLSNTDGEVTETTKLFNDVAKWEPGAVTYENLTVSNEGNLALKYKLSLIVANENQVVGGKGLSEALKVAVVEGGVDTTLTREELIASITDWQTLASWNKEGSLEATKSATYGVVIYWQPSANDNDWNVNNTKSTTDGKDLWIDLGVNLVATQLNHEDDSFDENYDKDATYTDVPTTPITGAPVYLFDLSNMSISSTPVNMDFTYYTFDANEFQGEYPVEIYKDWICDYYVSTDKPLNDGLMLIGQYDFWDPDNWYGFYAPQYIDEETNENLKYPPTPLLGTVTQNMGAWTYETICNFVQVFKCGIVDTQGLNNGTTVTVELRMLNPNDNSKHITVCSISVTFTEEVSNEAEMNEAIANGNTNLTLGDGNYTMPGVSNSDLTISGTEDTVITINKPAFHGSDVTFNGVTIKGSGYATGVQHVNTVTYNDATIVGVMCLYGEKVVFNNCTFDLTAVTDYVWTYGAKEVEFNNCTFNTNGKAILIYSEGANLVTKVTVKGCTFNATQSAQASGATAAAIEIDSSLATNGHYTLVTENNTVDSDFSGEWRIKKSGTNNTTVNGTVYNAITLDGVTQ